VRGVGVDRGAPQPSHAWVITLSVSGRHNLSNALACTAVGRNWAAVPSRLQRVWQALAAPSAGLDVRGDPHGILVIETTVITTRAARLGFFVMGALRLGRRMHRGVPAHRVQPDGGAEAGVGLSLVDADTYVLADIYAAGEDPIPGVTVEHWLWVIRDQDTPPGRRGTRANRCGGCAGANRKNPAIW